MFLLTIQLPHEERQIEVPEHLQHRLLTDVLRDAGVPLNTRCGHRGLCDGCLVELRDGCLKEISTDGVTPKSVSPEGDVEPDGTLVRGCRVSLPIAGTARIHVPARSLLAHQPQVVASFRLNVPRAHDPLWQKIRVAPTRVDKNVVLSEALRVAVAAELDCELPMQWVDTPWGDAIGGDAPWSDAPWSDAPWIDAPWIDATESHRPAATASDGEALLARSSAGGRDGFFELVVEHRGDYRVVRPCHLAEPAFGVAVDVGTTTVVVALVELATGQVVANASALNSQAKLGDNVLTRINLCMTQPRLIPRMQQAIVRSTLAPLISDVMRQVGIAPRQLTCMVVAGNTTMLHLLLGVDPTSLGTAPFTPTFLQHKIVSASDLSLGVTWPGLADGDGRRDALTAEASVGGEVSGAAKSRRNIPKMDVHLLPGAAAYIGADITAGVLASGMAYRDDTCLLVDLGTNGEIVLRHDGGIVGCATAAGPAFEGAGLAFGMRAGNGAIGHISFAGDRKMPTIEMIGQGLPAGICGTAYIDFVARARQQQLLTPTARFVVDDHPCIIQHETHGRAMVVARAEDAESILITEADMASLLQAKAAIAAGIICLLKEAELQPHDVQTVYLAGGFGFHMHLDSLLGCGMLPGFREEQVEAVGNTALAGAYLTLVDSSALREIRRVSRQMKIVELNLAPEFEMIYIDQLTLP